MGIDAEGNLEIKLRNGKKIPSFWRSSNTKMNSFHCIDVGNTMTKIATFSSNKLVKK